MWEFLYKIDLYFFRKINNLKHFYFLDKFSIYFHAGTSSGIIYAPFILTLLYFKKKKEALYTTVVILLTSSLNEFLFKPLFHRQRPFINLMEINLILPKPSGYSFPSSETAVAFAVAMAFVLLFTNRKKHLIWIWAILVGLDRIYMAHHYPSDVLVGAALGSLISFLTIKFINLKTQVKKLNSI